MLFSLPFEDIKITDVQELLAGGGYPESDQVEYKQYVPGRDGPDNWHKDPSKGIGDYARDKILSEVVAFANSHGGHLIIGVQESDDKPKRAIGITPAPACADLADRLRQAAFANIEPRLAFLQVKSVPTDEQGNGVLVVRVSQSRASPHRLLSTRSDTARHCYVRRGDSTETLTMREIHDLTLNTARGLDAVAHRQGTLRTSFQNHLAEAHLKADTHATIGIRATAVPLQQLLLQRSQLATLRDRTSREFAVTHSAGRVTQAFIPKYGWSPRPILRGLVLYNRDPTAYYEHAFYTDGSQNLVFINQEAHESEGDNVVFMDWLLGVCASLLHAVTAMSEIVESPAAEFAIEVEICGHKSGAKVVFGNRGRATLPDPTFVLPQYSFIPEEGPVALIDQIYGDVLNTLGYERTHPIVAVSSNG